jgi:hypothetical protein
MLNGPHGVIPHGFLAGEIPTTMWNRPDLFDMINKHLGEYSDVTSDFSSWTQMWTTALKFSRYQCNSGEGTIAIVDTSRIEEHVWHVVDLVRAEMAVDEYCDEFLIYGPVRAGPHYHCVSPRELYGSTRLGDLLTDAPLVFDDEDPGPFCVIERGAVEAAVDVAMFLQPRGAPVENIAALTARFVSYRVALLTGFARDDDWESETDTDTDTESSSDSDSGQGSDAGAGPRSFMSSLDIDTYLHLVRDQVQFFAMHTQDGEVSLVDDSMFADMLCLRIEVSLLQAVENAVRVMAYQVKMAMREMCRLQSRDERRVGDLLNRAGN